MMTWFDVDEKTLKEKMEVPTPMGETLYWDYYCYVKENPIKEWNVPTAIMYASEDNLTERGIVDDFCKKFDCSLTVLKGGEHWFHTERQLIFLDKWLEESI